MSEQKSQANDYALAKHLNERVAAIFALVADHYRHDIPDLTDINRSYVLLVHELKQLYNRNPELDGIRENICWRTFGTLDAMDSYNLYEYSEDYTNHGIQHISEVNSLCIIAGKEKPDISPTLQKVLDEASKSVNAFIAELDEAEKQREANTKGWYISEYKLSYDEIRGVIKINNVYQLNKRSTNDSSGIDKILAEGMKQPNQLFVPALQTTKNFSSIISNAGFTPTLRKLFIPVARKGKGVLVRPTVTRAEADAEGIDTLELDVQLKEAGATTQPVRPF